MNLRLLKKTTILYKSKIGFRRLDTYITSVIPANAGISFLTLIRFGIIAIICFTNNHINAQDLGYVDTTKSNTITINVDSLKKIYEENVLYLQNGKFVQGKKETRPGLLFKKYKKIISTSTDALADYAIYRRKVINGLLLIWGSAGAYIITTILTLNPATALFLIPIEIGVIKIAYAQNHIQSATWKYNRDILIQKLKLTKQ